MSERTSGPLWQVNRSNAFEISRNPWKQTDRAVYGYRLLQRCGFRPGSARNHKSARSPRAMSHNPGSDICLRGVKAYTHCHVGCECFLARSSCDQHGCTPQLMQVPVEDSRHVCDLHRSTARQMAATCPDFALMSPTGQELQDRTASSTASPPRCPRCSRSTQRVAMSAGAPGLRS